MQIPVLSARGIWTASQHPRKRGKSPHHQKPAVRSGGTIFFSRVYFGCWLLYWWISISFADDTDGLAGEEEELANFVERLDKASTAYIHDK